MAFKDAFHTFPVIETKRLVLNELVAGDAEAYHRQQRSALELPGRPPWNYGFEAGSAEKAARSFEFAHKAWLKKERIKWGIRLKEKASALADQYDLRQILTAIG